MPEPQQNSCEVGDNHVYQSIIVFRDTFQLLLKSLRFYRDILHREIEAVKLDDDLRTLLSDNSEETSVVQKELRKVDRSLEWFEKLRAESDELDFEYNIGNFSHEYIRYFKSVGLLYLKHLRRKRDMFSTRSLESKYVLEALDTAFRATRKNAIKRGVPKCKSHPAVGR
jgi:hypothetical protein